MTDYLGPLTLGTSGTYILLDWSIPGDGTATLSVVVDGASADALIAAIEALAAACQPGNTWAHYEVGATNPVLLRVSDCTSFVQSEDVRAWIASFAQRIDIGLLVSGQPLGALATPYNAQALNTPSSLTMAALLGTRPTPLDVTIDDSSGNDMHSVYAWLAPRALTATQSLPFSSTGARPHWLIDARSLTWTSMSAGGADAAMWFNRSAYTSSASWQTAPLDTSWYPAGTYKLLARVKQAAGTGYVMDSQNMKAVAVTRATPHLLEVGEVQLPVADSAYGSAANLTFYARSDGSNRLDVNAFVLAGPLSDGHRFFRWHHDVPTTELDQIDVGPTGVWMWTTGSGDGVADKTYFVGDVLIADRLAAHCGTLIATASPSGANWPSDWGRTDGTDVTASSSKFRIATTVGSKYAWYSATNTATPLVVPGEWYELTLNRQVTARAAGAAEVRLVWQDIDGNTVRDDLLDSVTGTDGSPVALELYGEAPFQAARALVKFGGGSGANLTVTYDAVNFRRCPLQLCVVAEDAVGALSSNTHAVAVTVKHTPAYEVGR